MIISIDTENTFDKIQHPIMIKNQSIEGIYLNIIKTIYDKPTANTQKRKAESLPAKI